MSQHGHFTHKDALLITLLGVFALFLFREIIIGGERLIGDDFIGFYLAMKKFFHDELWIHHSIPYWNPYIFGGIPFWAHFESTIFYPLGFLFWLIPPDRAYGYSMFLHFILAGLFTYGLMRSLKIGRAGSFVAGAVYTCNGFVMALLYIGHMCPIWSYIWLPAVLYCLNRAVSSATPYFSASIAGLLWGIQILAGAPQDAFYTFLASILFLATRMQTGEAWRTCALKLLAIASLFFMIGAGVAAMQIIPAFEFINESVRAGLDTYDMVTMASYPPQGIITALIPNFFGSYAEGTYWVKNVPWSIPQQNLYVGVLPLVLLSCIAYRRSANRRIILFAFLLAAFALVFALGRHTPVYKLAYLLPGFDRFRAPSKIIVLWVFGMAVLAALGMDELLRNRATLWRGFILCVIMSAVLCLLALIFYFDRPFLLKFFSLFFLPESSPDKLDLASRLIYSGYQRLVLAVLFILFSFYALTKGRWGGRLGITSLCLLLLLDLGSATYKSVRHDETIFQSIETIQKGLGTTLGRDKTLYRVGSYKHSLGPNLEMYLGYQTVGGFTALFPTRYYEYVNEYAEHQLPIGWESFTYGEAPGHTFMDLLNVKYGVMHSDKFCYVRETFLPRAFMVSDYKAVRKEEILKYIGRPDFEPMKLVLLEETPKPTSASSPDLVSKSSPKQVKITSYQPDRMCLVTEAAEAGFLFLSEIYYPGWKAFIDGRIESIQRGDYLFRVIQVPSGRHEVTLAFDPFSIKIGMVITVLTLFLLLVLILYRFRKKILFLPGG
jgi:hypothetical protein